MANKIVQLTDKTGTDNWFPIAGGMAADSITTQMLKDDSVTSGKVDFTTYSTTPTKVGTWIDGKELWRKTITANVAYSANVALSTSVNTGITNYSEMIGMDIRIDGDGTAQTVDIANYYSSNSNYFRAFFRTNTIQIRMMSPNTATAKCTFTVYYTVPTS